MHGPDGQSRAEMRGLGWLDAVHPEDRAQMPAAWTTAVEHTALDSTDDRVLCVDGICRWFNARGAPAPNRDGSVRDWVGVCLNVRGRARHGAAPPAAWRACRRRTWPGWRRSRSRPSTGWRIPAPLQRAPTRSWRCGARWRGAEIVFTFEPGVTPGLREA